MSYITYSGFRKISQLMCAVVCYSHNGRQGTQLNNWHVYGEIYDIAFD